MNLLQRRLFVELAKVFFLALAVLFLARCNFLVLDEPTNDLDTETLELLEELLTDYSGTVLVVSHDRRFLDNLVTNVIMLEGDGRAREYVGAYTDWLRQRPAPSPARNTEKTPRPVPRSAPAKARKRTFKEQREFEQLTSELKALPEHLDALEREQKDLETLLADPDLFTRDQAAFIRTTERLAALEEEQTQALLRWELVEQRLKELGELSG